jgi:hypothetical protein
MFARTPEHYHAVIIDDTKVQGEEGRWAFEPPHGYAAYATREDAAQIAENAAARTGYRPVVMACQRPGCEVRALD